MRNSKSIEVKMNTPEEDNRLDESKEEETPLQQIAKIVEKNGNRHTLSIHNLIGEFWIYHKG